MSKWFTLNGLSLNTDKTKVMKFNLNYLQNESFQCFHKDKLIKEVINTKYLGLEKDKQTNLKTILCTYCQNKAMYAMQLDVCIIIVIL
jgi:hypothetical protein